jgi:hypothetical protein
MSFDGTKQDVVTSRLNESDWMMKKFPQGDDGDEEVEMIFFSKLSTECLLLRLK